jgi:hypothetical protein
MKSLRDSASVRLPTVAGFAESAVNQQQMAAAALPSAR